MKREEILAMQPGRELDALIAELLFGWRRITGPKTDYDGPCEYGDVLIPPTVTEEEAFRMMPPKGAIPFYYFVNRNWSTAISAAMEVAHAVKEKAKAHVEIELFYDSRIDGRVTIYDMDDKEDIMIPFGEKQKAGFPRTLPEAICKAALLAVMDNDS